MKKLLLFIISLIMVISLIACGENVPGPKGDKGDKGDTGEAGVSPTVEISSDGYWVINGEKTEHKAIGEDGKNGTDAIAPTVEISPDGYWVINGEKTEHKAIGEDGKNGTDAIAPTVEISSDGYWVINGKKTEHKAIGEDGKNGTDGKAPTIAISYDGYWVINGEKTEHKAVGNNNAGTEITPDGDDVVTPPESSADPDDLSYIQNGNLSADYSDLKPEFRALLSTVRVVAHFQRIIYGNTTTQSKKESSGIIYKLDRESGDAYIITNFHAVYLKSSTAQMGISDNIELFLYGQENSAYSIKATYVGGSMLDEIAVLKVSASEVLKNSHALEFTPADPSGVRLFDDVFAMGNPEGLGLSVTEGIISVENEDLSIIGADGATTIKLRVMRISAAINEGNSGGGLFDKNGNLIGVVVAKRTGAEVDNIAYAIPVNVATSIADIIIENYDESLTIGYTEYQLGISPVTMASGVLVDPVTGTLIKEERVKIGSISAGSAFESVAKVGDIITSITVDGKTVKVTATYNITDSMLAARLGSTVTLTLLRDGKTLSYTVTVTTDMAVSVG